MATLALWLAACSGGGNASPPAPANPEPAPAPADISSIKAADPGSTLADGWHRGAFLQIYVRGYQDSNGDGIGDIKGLISRLDYIKDLGVKGIWLMPVTASQDNDHGYAVQDYRAIEPAFGTLADFDELLKQAHARGLGVIIDYVFNHSAAKNPIFIDSSSSTTSRFRDWYLWASPAPSGWNVWGSNPWRSSSTGAYYAPFWDQMPDWNLLNPRVITYHHDNLRFWLNRGVDGFRFDAVGVLVENGATQWENQAQNYTLLSGVRSLMNGYSRRYLVCEGPSDSQGYARDSACGSAFGFDLQAALLGAARNNTSAIAQLANYFTRAPAGIAPMLANHDSFAGRRIFDQLSGNLKQYRLAAASYLLLPGTPFIYYGEEIGMAGASSLQGDWQLRTPMAWTPQAQTAGFTSATPFRALSDNIAIHNVQSQSADPDSLLNFYKAMLRMRNSLPSIANGSYESPWVSGSILAFQRATSAHRSVVVLNYGSAASSVNLPGFKPGAVLTPAYPAAGSTQSLPTANDSGQVNLNLPAQSVVVYTVTPP
jgi:alpha-amylase